MKFLICISIFLFSCEQPTEISNLNQVSCSPQIETMIRVISTELYNSQKPFIFTFFNSYYRHNNGCKIQDSAELDVIVQNISTDTISMAFKVDFKTHGSLTATHFGWRLDGMVPGEQRKLVSISKAFLDDLDSYEIEISAYEISYSNP